MIKNFPERCLDDIWGLLCELVYDYSSIDFQFNTCWIETGLYIKITTSLFSFDVEIENKVIERKDTSGFKRPSYYIHNFEYGTCIIVQAFREAACKYCLLNNICLGGSVQDAFLKHNKKFYSIIGLCYPYIK